MFLRGIYMKKTAIMAIMYDFDKTLCTTDMQNYGFIPALNMTPEEFWGATGQFSAKTGCERILSYMYMMVYLSKQKGIKLTKKWLNSLGKGIIYFSGVEEWFDRINKYGEERGVKVEHYLCSSGTKEIVEGCSIAKKFRKIYGCEFYFDPVTDEPIWPKLAINYTQKTQYFFRISKGVYNVSDDNSVNTKTKKRRIPYSNIVYLGDGLTDVPCMVLVKQNGGKSIAIHQKKDTKNMVNLIKEGRVNFACLADYNDGSDLDQTMKLIIDRIAVETSIARKETAIIDKVNKAAKKMAEEVK